MLASLRDLDLGSATGWTLVHATWQGALVVVIYWLAKRCHARPTLRYVIGNTCLLAFLAAQALTFAYCVVAHLRPDLLEQLRLLGPAQATMVEGSSGFYLVRSMPIASLWARMATLAEPVLPWLCVLWAIGLGWRTFRAAGALMILRRELDRCSDVSDVLRVHALRACERLRLTRPVRFLESASVSVPATAGWLKPVVLVPSSALLQLRPEHLEAMILHELAHVFRGDYLAGLLRSWVESAYFFHPLLRGLTRDLADDAEKATDELAARACRSRREYADALLTLEEHRPALPGVLGVDGRLPNGASAGSLRARLRNLVADHAAPRPGQRRLSAAGPFLTALLLVTLLSQTLVAAASDRTMASRARSETLVHAVLSEVSDDRANPNVEPALARAVDEVRAGGSGGGGASRPTLDALARQLLIGVRGELLTDLRDLGRDIPLQRGLSPVVVAEFGTAGERDRLVSALRGLAVADANRGRARGYARAALCLACLDPATANGGGRSLLLLQPDFVALLQLTAGQQRRLDLAVRAENERSREATHLIRELCASGRAPTDAELATLTRTMSLLPALQSTATADLPPEVQRALARFVRENATAPPATSLARLLRVADEALADPERQGERRTSTAAAPAIRIGAPAKRGDR